MMDNQTILDAMNLTQEQATEYYNDYVNLYNELTTNIRVEFISIVAVIVFFGLLVCALVALIVNRKNITVKRFFKDTLIFGTVSLVLGLVVASINVQPKEREIERYLEVNYPTESIVYDLYGL